MGHAPRRRGREIEAGWGLKSKSGTAVGAELGRRRAGRPGVRTSRYVHIHLGGHSFVLLEFTRFRVKLGEFE